MIAGKMKLLVLCEFLFVFLLFLNAFTAEGTVYPYNTIVSYLILCFCDTKILILYVDFN